MLKNPSALNFRVEGGVSEKSSLVSFRSVRGDLRFLDLEITFKGKN